MAKLKSFFPLTGTLDNLTAYRLPGVEDIVVRRKGGVPAEVIRTSLKYENTRRNNVEFRGRSIGSGWIMRAMHPVKELADYSVSGMLNALLKPVQEQDTTSEFGKRHIKISRSRRLLQGFSLNHTNPLTSVIRTQPKCSINRDAYAAIVEIPEFIPQVNFFPSAHAQLYSLVATLGMVPDLFYSDGNYIPSHADYGKLTCAIALSPWQPCILTSVRQSLSMQLSAPAPDDNFSLILSIGVRYGEPWVNGGVRQKKKNPGCGAIVAVG